MQWMAYYGSFSSLICYKVVSSFIEAVYSSFVEREADIRQSIHLCIYSFIFLLLALALYSSCTSFNKMSDLLINLASLFSQPSCCYLGWFDFINFQSICMRFDIDMDYSHKAVFHWEIFCNWEIKLLHISLKSKVPKVKNFILPKTGGQVESWLIFDPLRHPPVLLMAPVALWSLLFFLQPMVSLCHCHHLKFDQILFTWFTVCFLFQIWVFLRARTLHLLLLSA